MSTPSEASTPTPLPRAAWAGRTLLALVAMGLGILMMAVAGAGHPSTEKLATALAQWWMFAWAGAGLFAFGMAQALHVVYVRGGQRLDHRIWARLTAAQRGRSLARDATSGRVAGWSFLLLIVAQTLWLDWQALPALWRMRVWVPGTTILLLINMAAAMLPGLAWFARQDPGPGASERVGPGHWVFQIHQDPAGSERFGVFLGVAGACFFAALGWGTPDVGDATIMAVFTLAALAYAGERLRATLRAYREDPGPCRLEIRRTAAHPVVLVGRAGVPPQRRKLATTGWKARLVGESMVQRPFSDPVYETWLDIQAPGHVEAGTPVVEFTLRVDLPARLPPGVSRWILSLTRPGQGHSVTLPDEVIFPQRDPA